MRPLPLGPNVHRVPSKVPGRRPVGEAVVVLAGQHKVLGPGAGHNVSPLGGVKKLGPGGGECKNWREREEGREKKERERNTFFLRREKRKEEIEDVLLK